MPLPAPHIERYEHWLGQRHGLQFDSYEALWRWSVTDLEAFWRSIWEYFELQSPTPFTAVLAEDRMPGATWFPGAQVNYARQVMRHADEADVAGHPAIVFADEARLARGEVAQMRWPELRRQVASLAARLVELGVQPGDRVAAYLPNVPQTVVAFLAAASIGAVWSVCSPDMGPVAVLDRFRQIEPRVLIACDGHVNAGQVHDRRAVVQDLLAQLPTVAHVVSVPVLDAQAGAGELAAAGRQAHDWAAMVAGDRTFEPRWLPFDHPLWIVYSSGTTGLPKPIVHGHGGVVLEHLKLITLHNDIGPSAQGGDRFHWYSSTGWIMWNCQVGGLLGGTTICLFDGSPGGTREAPDAATLWRFAALAGATFFGAGAAFHAGNLKADVHPMRAADLSRLRAVGSTGSPLADDCYDWLQERLPRVDGHPMWIAPISGGTDFAGAFLAGHRGLPLVRGEMQCRCLGAAVEAWSDPDAHGRGRPLVDEVGELVCTRPMPSMPLYLWGDADGSRLRESYFDMYRDAAGRPVWRHGDWLRLVPHGSHHGAIIYGRSDATINRHGIRMGTAELYRAVEALPEVLDSLVVDLEYLGRESWMPLFVVLREGLVLDDALAERIRRTIRTALSARHVPNDIYQVGEIPRTLSGKKLELPVKKLLMGQAVQQVVNREAMANPASLDGFIALARQRAGG